MAEKPVYQKPDVTRSSRQLPSNPGPIENLSDRQIEDYAGALGEQFPDVTDSETIEKHLRERRAERRRRISGFLTSD